MRRRSSTIQAASLEEYYDISISQGLELESSSSSDFPESTYCRPLPEYKQNWSKTGRCLELADIEEDDMSDDEDYFTEETPSTEADSPMAKSDEEWRRFSCLTYSGKPIIIPNEVQIIKSMIIGATGTGKYGLVDQIFDEMEQETQELKSGFDLIIKNKEEIGLTKTYKMWMQDPSHQHIDALLQVYYRSISNYVFTYKVEDRESFEILDRVIGQVKAKVGDKFRAVLIGTVSEGQEARRVDSEEGERLRRKYQLEKFVEGNGASEFVKTTFFDLLA